MKDRSSSRLTLPLVAVALCGFSPMAALAADDMSLVSIFQGVGTLGRVQIVSTFVDGVYTYGITNINYNAGGQAVNSGVWQFGINSSSNIPLVTNVTTQGTWVPNNFVYDFNWNAGEASSEPLAINAGLLPGESITLSFTSPGSTPVVSSRGYVHSAYALAGSIYYGGVISGNVIFPAAAVPEPASLMLSLLGIGLIALRVRQARGDSCAA